jgi:predicted O-linked N-acetylglucosamine transferase (SPINDLY family)
MTQITLQQALQLAAQHQQAGRVREAEVVYQQILAQQPENVDALHQLGRLACQVGRYDVGVDLIGRAAALRPNSAELQASLGRALKGNGQPGDAIAAYRRAIALNPAIAETHNNLGNALREHGDIDEAIAAYQTAIALRPEMAQPYSNLSRALRDRGRLDESIAACRHAVRLSPNLPEAHNNLGSNLRIKGLADEAIVSCQTAIALRPNFPEAFVNLGNALKDKGQLDEAIAAFQQAIALSPGFAEAHGNLGNAFKDAGRLDEAIASYRQAISIAPNLPEPYDNLVYALWYHPAYDAAAIAREHQQWNRQHAEPLKKFIQPHDNDRSPSRRLRIGYVSPDFRDHVVGRNILPLLERHDAEQFEVFCYSNSETADEMTEQIKSCAPGWRNILGNTDAEAAAKIRADRIDILVDLSLHMLGNRLPLFARKPAPVQITFAGYPGTTGLEAIDWRITDRHLEPPGSEHAFVEKPLVLPDTFWCYDPRSTEPAVNVLPAMQAGYITFGCLNNFCKLNDAVLTLWAKVMRQVEHSRLLLLAPEGKHRIRTLEFLSAEGIGAERVEFVGHQSRGEYLLTYHRIDLGLDTFPYNGHTTSLDSAWMGVPVVTLVGSISVGRAGLSQLSNIGLEELAGATPDEFMRIAVELAGDLPRLTQLRSALRQRMEQSPLMDAGKFARDIEAAYRAAWQAWCEGLINPQRPS